MIIYAGIATTTFIFGIGTVVKLIAISTFIKNIGTNNGTKRVSNSQVQDMETMVGKFRQNQIMVKAFNDCYQNVYFTCMMMFVVTLGILFVYGLLKFHEQVGISNIFNDIL